MHRTLPQTSFTTAPGNVRKSCKLFPGEEGGGRKGGRGKVWSVVGGFFGFGGTEIAGEVAW